MRADDLRAELERTVGALLAKEFARGVDFHGDCGTSDHCVAVEWTELGENQWEQLPIPKELTDNDDEVERASEIMAEFYRAEWIARVKRCK